MKLSLIFLIKLWLVYYKMMLLCEMWENYGRVQSDCNKLGFHPLSTHLNVSVKIPPRCLLPDTIFPVWHPSACAKQSEWLTSLVCCCLLGLPHREEIHPFLQCRPGGISMETDPAVHHLQHCPDERARQGEHFYMSGFSRVARDGILKVSPTPRASSSWVRLVFALEGSTITINKSHFQM